MLNHQLTRNLLLAVDDIEFSQAVRMEENTNVQVLLKLLAYGGGTWSGDEIKAELQGSNDLDNWFDVGTTVTASTEPPSSAQGSTSGAYWTFVRLLYDATGLSSGRVTVAADISISRS